MLCDIERPLSNRLMQAFNRMIGWRMIRAAATQNVEGDHVGLPNKIFAYAYQVRLLGKRIKVWNKPTYYLIKWLCLGSLFYAIFF